MIGFSKNIQNLGLPYLFVAFLLFLSVFGLRFFFNIQNEPKTISRNFQRSILQTEERAKKSVELLSSRFVGGFNNNLAVNNSQVQKMMEEGIFLFVFKKDSLLYWNNNKIILPEKFGRQLADISTVEKLKNGWYGFTGKKSGQYYFLGCYLIKSEFPFQNDFLKNKFSPQFNCPEAVLIDKNNIGFPVFSGDGSYLLSLNFSGYSGTLPFPPLLYFFLFVTGSLCLFFFIYRLYHYFPWFDDRRNLMVLFYVTDLLLLRVFQYWLKFPQELTQSELFSPGLYSSTAILPSLGDFSLNVILLFVISLVISRNVSINHPEKFQAKARSLILNSSSIFFVLFFFHFVGFIISDLVINSSLSLNLQDISGLTYESGYGLFIVAIMLFSFWLISTRVFNDIISTAVQQKFLVLYAGIAGILYYLICLTFIGQIDYIILLFFYFYLVSYWYIKSKSRTIFSVHNLLFFLCFYAVFATIELNRSNNQKKEEKLKLLAVKLSTRRNPVTEVRYEQLERKLLSDTVVKGFIKPLPNGSRIRQDSLMIYLKERYFNDYWKKYDIQITVCDSIKELRIQPQGYLINCGTYFHGIVKDYGEPTQLPNLFFLDYGFGKEYYLAILSEGNSNQRTSFRPSLILEFNLLNSYPDPGYPGLLMDNTRIDLPNLSDYSYGLFQHGRLVHSVGSYNYRMELGQYKSFSTKHPFFPDDQMVHYQYTIDRTNLLLISKNEENFLTLISPFPYLFVFFTVIALLVSVLIYYPRNPHIIPASLRNRLHLSLIGVLVVTFIVIGIVQIINIININSKKNIANLREKAYSVQVEVQHRYSALRAIEDVPKSELEDFLIKLSNVFFTDINFYDTQGIVLASSRRQIFDEGLVSGRMNPDAYVKLIIEKGSAFIHNESIGSMHFSSAYLPLYNEQNRLLGYINLPYFSRQDEMKKEISTFLVTFVNIYILLILFGVFITILISNYITAPLAILSEKMSRLRLGLVNDKIEWKQDDEIGQLVLEYNRMIDELGRSAEVLARSEREGAWREMARQVAHEIKNPLTPMKLSAQHLQKAWIEKAPDMDERLARFTRTLIEQIDTLSAIASDFSSFAKMPAVINERINLKELILFVLSMYRDTSEIQYDFHCVNEEPYLWADRALLIRIFTNLLNNAIQAIGDSPGGLISIQVSAEQLRWNIAISDNGSGISTERAEKIFQPDFTTKTGGMGLGLAIVKSIVAGMHGEISFTSQEHEGTTFILKLPADDIQKQNETV